MGKRKRKVLPGTYIVDRIVTQRKKGGKVEFLVAWHGYGPEDNTWEPGEHLPTGMVHAFLNPREKEGEQANSLQDNPRRKKDVAELGESSTNTDQKALQHQLLNEIATRKTGMFSKKSRTSEGTFTKKETCHLAWRNYVRSFFKQHEGFHMLCCENIYNKADSFITHYHRHHT